MNKDEEKKIKKIDSNKMLKKNYLYNVFYQVFALIVIFITTPYVTRVLGAEGVGIYSFTYSYVTYFVLFGSLGIALYGQREIAYHQDDIKKRSVCFFEILFLRLFILLLATILFVLMFCRNGDYALYYKILLFELVGSGLDIMWLYSGLEDFKRVILRNVVLRLLCTLSIFIFVKTQTDLWKYVLVSSLATFLGNVSLWFNIKKYICLVDFKSLNLKKHIRPILVLFIPQIAVQVYNVIDKTMIGLITNNMSYVGIYQKTQEIVKLALTIITSFGTVVFSRMASNYVRKDKKEMDICVESSFSFVWLIGLPLMFGLMACANNFVPWYLGNEFESAKSLLMIFSIIIIAIGLNNVVGMQYLIATNQQKKYTIAVLVGAFINVIGNYFLIKLCNNYGAVISSILSETIILSIELVLIRKQIKGLCNWFLFGKSLFSSLVMFAIVFRMGYSMQPCLFTTVIQAFVGITIYFLLLILLREKIVINNLSLIIKKIRRK